MFKPGDNKPEKSGRGPGTPNKVTAEVRELITAAIGQNTPRMIQIMAESQDETFAKLYLELLKYILPQLSKTEFKGEIDNLNEKIGSVYAAIKQEPNILEPKP